MSASGGHIARVGRLLAICIGPIAGAAEAGISAAQLEFFEAKVRPILVEACYKCHSLEAGKSKGGLQLDTAAGLRRGGETGPAIVPGEPDRSLLIEAVRYASEDLQMPPKEEGGRLTAEQVARLAEWVRMGAPDPRTGGKPHPLDMAAARRHWAFQPVRKPTVPAVAAGTPVATPVDAFVRAGQQARNLKAAPAADARTLLRRVTYDLTGLPPTLEEMEAFARDYPRDAAAYDRVVERLLASPRYGERWGRFWLDVARYADTQGYLVGNAERRFAYSHTYRDYVIRAFNDDKPFDQFIVEQIAADRLPLGDDKSALAALGFLTLGRRFLGNQNDIIDDRIDVVTRGLMGLTVTCARCHDHKFDPVPARDYYALHGVFASSEEPAEKPLLGPLVETPAYHEFLNKREQVQAKIAERERSEVEKFLVGLRSKTGDYLLGVHEAKRLKEGEKLELFAGTRKLNLEVLKRWQVYLDAQGAAADSPFGPWLALAELPEEGFAEKAAALLAAWQRELPTATARGEVPVPGDTPLDSLAPRAAIIAMLAAAAKPVASLKDVAEAYNRVFAEPEKKPASKGAAAVTVDRAALAAVIQAEDFPGNLGYAAASTMIRRQLNDRTAALRRELEALNWTEPGAPLRAMALVDREKPRNSAVLLRGNPANKGPEVPRQFLEIVAGEKRAPFVDGSGRLELARAIASAANPLTARVWVNRVWGWHFGQALVRTPSDFGVRTEAPALAELLDWLAASFVENGWSVKGLHRAIVRSHVYRQASDVAPEALAADPDNHYVTRHNRRRLEFEALRDTLLVAAGQLDLRPGGLSDDLVKEPFARRRAVYGFIDRQNLPGMFRTFDYPNPDVSSAQRFTTTVPQQALFLLNSPFVLEMARGLAARVARSDENSSEKLVARMYQALFQRQPDRDEQEMAREFLQTAGVPTETDGSERRDAGQGKPSGIALTRREALAQVLLLSNELAFVD